MSNISRFKNSGGNFYLQALFWDKNTDPLKTNSIYTLKDEDHTVGNKTYPSLRKLYVALEDLTEYEFSQKYLGGWPHWKKLRECSWFQPFYEEWREELEIRVRARALNEIKAKAYNPDHKDNLTASKFIVSGGWEKKPEKGGVGRTTKQKIQTEAEKLFKTKDEIEEDYNRLLN